jgi:hypothetical protein
MVFEWLICRLVLSVAVPPICPGKERDGDEENSQLDECFLRLEQEEKQDDPNQHRAARGQVMGGEIAEKIFDFVRIHD